MKIQKTISYSIKNYKYLINPCYQQLQAFINNIPEIFEKEGKIIYTGRNLIKVIKYDSETTINVKRYAIPIWINRIAYTFFRPSKGKRAFYYPGILQEKGIETPAPIAYIEERKYGLIRYSYFISIQSPYKRTLYEFGEAEVDNCKDFITAFAHYTAKLHQAGILHLDYSPGNVLFDVINGKYYFSLVDINRMKFGKVSEEAGCANFAKLWGKKEFFIQLAKEYAQIRHIDETFCINKILYYRKKFWTRYAKRHKVLYKLEL